MENEILAIKLKIDKYLEQEKSYLDQVKSCTTEKDKRAIRKEIKSLNKQKMSLETKENHLRAEKCNLQVLASQQREKELILLRKDQNKINEILKESEIFPGKQLIIDSISCN